MGTSRVDRNNRFTISLGGSIRARRMDRVGTQEWLEDTFVPDPAQPYALARTQRSERSVSGALTNVGWDITTDVRGRTTAGAWDSIEYTEFDLPRRVVDGGVATAFLYDAQGRRVRKTSPTRDTITIGPIYERHTQSGVIRHVARVYAESQVVAELNFDSAGRMTAEAVFSDHLGSPILKTDTAGAVTESRWYGPFGRELDATGRPITPNPTDDRLGFTGHRQDPELAWVDMGGRIYDPMTSRFLTPDPIRETFDPFSYARNIPFNRIDPSGFQTTNTLTRLSSASRPAPVDRMEMILLERLRSSVGWIERMDIKGTGAGHCDDLGACARADSVGETTQYVSDWDSIDFSDDEVGEEKARPYIIAAYDPDDWDEFHEDEAFNEAVSHSAANVVTLWVPATIDTAAAVIEDARAGNVPSVDRYVRAFVQGTVQLVRSAASDQVGAERGAARGALVGQGVELVARAVMGGLAAPGAGRPGVRRAGRVVLKDGCFDGTTLITTSDGFVPIESVIPGQFVLPAIDGCEGELPRLPVRSTYVSIQDSSLTVELLESTDVVPALGDLRYLDVVELGISGWFAVDALENLTTSELQGAGCPVLGRVRRTVNEVLEIIVSDGVRTDHIVTTAEHPFHSADRGEWVLASDLQLGERLVANRANLKVVGVSTGEGREVFNLWVAGSHRYRVGQLGVEVHNTCWTDRAIANGWRVLEWMRDHSPHGHHIIPKGLTRFQVVRDLHQLAARFGFDLRKIWYDRDNLTIAPNGGGLHSVAALEVVFRRLAAAETESQFRAILRQLATEINDGSFFQHFVHPSNTFR